MKTMTIGKKQYAQVKDRLKAFREENPKGKIETSFSELGENVVLKAEITKEDGSVATGQAMGNLKEVKAFEKLESIAVGRALALMGYLADGEIASSEEMEEFIEYKNTQRMDAITALKDCKDLAELKVVFMSLGNLMADKDIIKVKNELKTTLK